MLGGSQLEEVRAERKSTGPGLLAQPWGAQRMADLFEDINFRSEHRLDSDLKQVNLLLWPSVSPSAKMGR